MAMTNYDDWKALNEMNLKSTTRLGLGGATPTTRVSNSMEDLIKGNLPPLMKARGLIDLLANTVAQLEDKERSQVISIIQSKFKPEVKKVVTALDRKPPEVLQ